jgi:hypothetical protein
MTRRHLRIWYIGPDGKEIDRSPLSSVLMPACKVPLTRKRALVYVGAAPKERRLLGVTILFNERRRTKPLFRAVVVVACPDRSTLQLRERRLRTPGLKVQITPYNAYAGSYCALSPGGQVVAGDFCEPTLGMAHKVALENVRETFRREPPLATSRQIG